MLNRFFSRTTSDDASQTQLPSLFSGSVQQVVNSAPQAPKADLQTPSPTIAVLGAKGGCGATTVAINLASALAARNAITLVDGNLHLPTIAHTLGQVPPHSLLELVAQGTKADEHLFQACAATVGAAGALRFLSPPMDGSATARTNLTELAQTLKNIRSYSNLWVFDLPNKLDRHLVTTLDDCSKIILVFEATVAGVAACRRWLEDFQELGYDKERVVCVLNRSGSKFKAVEDQIDSVFHDREVFRLPNAYQLIWQSTTEAVPAVLLQPNHAFSRAVTKLSEVLVASIKE